MIKQTDKITIDGKQEIFGGKIYSANYNIGFNESPSSLTISVVNEDGNYSISESDPCINSPVTIKMGTQREVTAVLIEYRLEESPANEILQLEYVDMSVWYLDNFNILLKYFHFGEDDESPSSIVFDEEKRILALGQKYDADDQSLSASSPTRLPSVLYTASELYSGLQKAGIPMHESVSQILTDANYSKLKRDYIGTIREVLGGFATDLAFSFYWDEDNLLHFIDMREGFNISNALEKAQSINHLQRSLTVSLKDSLLKNTIATFLEDGQSYTASSAGSSIKTFLFNALVESNSELYNATISSGGIFYNYLRGIFDSSASNSDILKMCNGAEVSYDMFEDVFFGLLSAKRSGSEWAGIKKEKEFKETKSSDKAQIQAALNQINSPIDELSYYFVFSGYDRAKLEKLYDCCRLINKLRKGIYSTGIMSDDLYAKYSERSARKDFGESNDLPSGGFLAQRLAAQNVNFEFIAENTLLKNSPFSEFTQFVKEDMNVGQFLRAIKTSLGSISKDAQDVGQSAYFGYGIAFAEYSFMWEFDEDDINDMQDFLFATQESTGGKNIDLSAYENGIGVYMNKETPSGLSKLLDINILSYNDTNFARSFRVYGRKPNGNQTQTSPYKTIHSDIGDFDQGCAFSNTRIDIKNMNFGEIQTFDESINLRSQITPSVLENLKNKIAKNVDEVGVRKEYSFTVPNIDLDIGLIKIEDGLQQLSVSIDSNGVNSTYNIGSIKAKIPTTELLKVRDIGATKPSFPTIRIQTKPVNLYAPPIIPNLFENDPRFRRR